jgi:hypothetical protein
VEELIKNKLGLQVLTDTGWSDFDGVLNKGQRQVALVQLEQASIRATLDHKIFTDNFVALMVKQLKPGVKIHTTLGIQKVVSVTILEIETVYDLLNVKNNHRFYANGILCSNCEFIIFDETLINPLHLVEMAGIDPIERQGQVRWYKKPEKGFTYIVGLDPSLGTGGDYAAIQVVELPSMKQVAEWQHNKTPIQKQVGIMKEICQYLYDSIVTETNIYYSVENNTLGEAALVTIAELGEENIRGTFLSEPRRAGVNRSYRKGFTTTNKTKIAVCAKFKALIENRRLHLASNNIISELKNFVAAGTGFAAKIGETDDLVMAMLLCIRMVQLLQTFDADLDENVRNDLTDFIDPMPFVMLSGF